MGFPPTVSDSFIVTSLKLLEWERLEKSKKNKATLSTAYDSKEFF